MKALNGKKIASQILVNLKKKLKNTKSKPTLAVVLVGHDPASKLYVSLKQKQANLVGIDFKEYHLPTSTEELKIIDLIKELNEDNSISGIIVQLPLPVFLNTDKIINTIDPLKDVDGFTKKNRKEIALVPVLPQAFLEILDSIKFKLKDKKIAAVVNSEIFGKTLKNIFEKEGASCDFLVKMVCLDRGLENFLNQADVVISATGCPELIKGNMLKKDAVVLDAGIFKENKKVLGDVDWSSISQKAAWATPTPGGVGPVTVAVLLRNVFLASKLKNK